MAGDWIKMRGNLWDDPRVAKLCDLTECGEAQIVGGLYWLWATADQHTENGIMPWLTLRQIDRKTGIPGFGQSLCDIGWLADHPEGVRVVNRSSRGEPLFIVGIDRPRAFSSVWRKLRAAVFARDGLVCRYCGKDSGPMECDHVTPIALGGRNVLENLATACFACNRSKGAKTVDQWRFNHGR